MSVLLRCLPVFLSFLVAASLTAQDRAGSVYLDGGTNFFAQRAEGSLPDAHILRSRALLGSYLRGASHRSGYFLTNRLLAGARVEYLQFWFDRDVNLRDNSSLRAQPFLRYYFLDLGRQQKFLLFGEAGLGTFTPDGGPLFEKDWHVGLGAEARLGEGVLGTVAVNYHDIESGRNAVSLNVGLNILTGQLARTGSSTPLQRGTWLTNGQVGRVVIGVGKQSAFVADQLALHLSPRLGYVFLPGLLLEVGADWQRQVTNPYSKSDIEYLGGYPFDRRTLNVQMRYYPLRQGRRLLPFLSINAGAEWLRHNGVYGGPLYLSYSTPHIGAGTGASYFIADRIALDLSGTYRRELLSERERTAEYRTELPKQRFTGEVGLRYFLR